MDVVRMREERKELVGYAEKLAALSNSNGDVIKWIETLDDPSYQLELKICKSSGPHR